NESTNNFSVERRLHFQTAYYYLNIGCPLLALEILAKLPANIILSEENKTPTETTNGVPAKAADIMDWGQPVSTKAEDDELKLEWSDDEKEEEEEKKVEEQQQPVTKSTDVTENKSVKQQFDTIGQYMKLICCLKIIVEEMATLATGFEVAGGQLR